MTEVNYSIMFTIDSWYVLTPIALISLIAFFGWAYRKGWKLHPLQYVLVLSFEIYLLSMFHLVFFPIDVNLGMYANQIPWYRTINFIPILTIDVKTFLLNILMFVPFGMYLPFFKERLSVKQVIKIGFYFSLSLEVTQLLIRATLGSGRSTDINDLLANTLGAVIGFLVVRYALRFQPLLQMFTKIQL